MERSQKKFWRNYIGHARLNLSFAAYTKVPTTWNEFHFTPDFHKLYYIIEGEGFVRVNQDTYYPKPGELYLLPAGAIQSYGTLNENTFGKYWCHFSATLGSSHLLDIVDTPISIKVKDPQKLQEQFQELIHYSNSDKLSSEFHIQSILLAILALFIDERNQTHTNIMKHTSFDNIRDVIHYIDEHIRDSLSIEQLAAIVNFHPNYFIKVFKEVTGSSPIQYIKKLRLERAKHLLISSDYSVSEVADLVGMDLPYFSRNFKEFTGFTATNYRDMIKHSD
ncbi:AraC family transcriptional regulator [Halalkalibacter kiskunsagensis]|uniref:AraC family transcriptional regulator n=1 Tax=Halalkalibacter kiskunsagensis TaxID=1548599 RepID=A0ABV6KFP7_9BACI